MKLIKNIVLFGLAFLLTLIGLEIFISTTEIQSKGLNMIDKTMGRMKRPGAKYSSFNEGLGLGRFNDYGYLGPSYPPEKDSGVFRIALLGDSFVEGIALFNRHHFRTLLEDTLQQILKQPVQVLNFGLSGFRLGNMYVYYEWYVKRFHPDLTLFFIFDLSLDQSLNNYFPKPIIRNDSLIIDNSHIIKNFASLQFNNKLSTMSSILVMIKNAMRLAKDKDYVLSMLLDKFYRKSYIQKLDDAEQKVSMDSSEQKILRKILEKLQNEPVIIVNRSIEAQPLIPPDISIKEIFTQPYINKAFENPQDAVYWPVTNKYGHWNHKAHKVIAKALSTEIYQFLQTNKKNNNE